MILIILLLLLLSISDSNFIVIYISSWLFSLISAVSHILTVIGLANSVQTESLLYDWFTPEVIIYAFITLESHNLDLVIFLTSRLVSDLLKAILNI